MGHYAVVIVDLINDFVHGHAPDLPPARNGQAVLRNASRVLDSARSNSVPVVYVNDRFSDAEIPIALEFKLWGPHALEGDGGAEIPEEIAPRATDFRLTKKRYDGFFGTSLELLLRELEVETIIFFGIQTDCCVQHTVMSAFFRGFKTVAVSDCCDTNTDEGHAYALNYMKTVFGTRLMTADEAVSLLGQKVATPV